MKLATIRKRKKKLIENHNSWVKLSGDERKAYKELCAKERSILIKHLKREVTRHGE